MLNYLCNFADMKKYENMLKYIQDNVYMSDKAKLTDFDLRRNFYVYIQQGRGK